MRKLLKLNLIKRLTLPFLLLGMSACDVGSGLTLVDRDHVDSDGGERSSPTTPSIPIDDLTGTYGVKLSPDGGVAYVGAGKDGVVRIDVSNPLVPKITGYAKIPGISTEIDLSPDGKTVFTSGNVNGIGINDLAITERGDIVYVATTDSSLLAMDISNTSKPVRLSINTELRPSSINHLLLSSDGTLLYVACEDAFSNSGSVGKLYIIDVSDAYSPKVVGRLDFSADLVRLALSITGSHLFAAAGDAGVLVIDISDPTMPEIIFATEISGFARDVLLSPDGQRLYVGHAAGVEVLDASTSGRLSWKSGIHVEGGVNSLALRSDQAFLFATGKGLQVIDLSLL